MATLYDDCDAIDANAALSPSEKARQKASLKAAGIRDAILAAWTFPKTLSFSKSGHAYVITIASVTVRSITAADVFTRDLLSIQGSATRDGVKIKSASGSPLFPIEIYNPPCLITDAAGSVTRGSQKFTYDLVTLLQGLLSDAIGTL